MVFAHKAGHFHPTLSKYDEVCYAIRSFGLQVDTINQLKTNREFFLSFSMDPQQFIQKWLVSQSRDLKVSVGPAGAGGDRQVSGGARSDACGPQGMGLGAGGAEEERRGALYAQAWAGEGVARYLTARLAQRRRELELALHPPHAPHQPHQPHPHLQRL